MSSSLTLSQVLDQRAQAVAVRRDEHALAALDGRRNVRFSQNGKKRATVSFKHSVAGNSLGDSLA